jgi:superfamily II DNA or RNA helicase
VVKDLLEENSNSQIMILAHNKSLLTYLYQGIEFQKIGSVGYYIGGMKEKALKESEKKQIIIATYAMASEALDIKTLTTLVMATPKTDIEQSVGRILREKHSKPIVVDIIDSHSIFQNQWTKRQKFYRNQKYKILKSDNIQYIGANTKWKLLAENGKSVKTKDLSDVNDLPQGKCLVKLTPKK